MVGDANVRRVVTLPDEYDAVRVVHADAAAPIKCALEVLETVARRHAQIPLVVRNLSAKPKSRNAAILTLVRVVTVLVLLLAATSCGGETLSSPADAGVDAAGAGVDAYADPCEQETTHDVCLAAVGCAWYSDPMCTGGSPFPINPGGCYSAALGTTPQCATDADCAAGDECIFFAATEECGPGTMCPRAMCAGTAGVASSWCRPTNGT
jgi:hypothetical protein